MDTPFPTDGSEFYNALTQGAGSPPMQDPTATLMAALSAPPPQPNMPQRQPADMSGIMPMLALQAAAHLAQRRAVGQSRTSQLMDALAQGGSSAMSMKAQAEDRAATRYKEDLLAAQTQSTIGAQQAATESSRTSTTLAKAKAPLEMQSLQLAITTARDTAELKQIEVRMAKVKESYQKQVEEASIALTNAKTGEEKAHAEAELSNAQANLRTAGAHEMAANAQRIKVESEIKMQEEGRKAGDFKVDDNAMPGQPKSFTYKTRDGNVMTGTMPMSQGEAIRAAKDEYKTLKSVGMTQDDENTFVQKRLPQLVNPPSYQQAVTDMQVRRGSPGGVPGSAPPSVPAPSAAPTPPASAANIPPEVKSAPAATWRDKSDGILHYFIGGQEVDQATFQSRNPTATGQQVPPGQSPSAQAPAPSNSAPIAEQAKELTGANATQRQQIQQEINNLLAASNTPNINVQQRQALSFRIATLVKKKAALEGIYD